MYFNGNDMDEFLGHRVEQMAEFLTLGWGYVNKDDLFGLFNVPKASYHHFIRVINSRRYTIKEEGNYFYHEVYKGYKPTKKYMNALSVLISLARKNPKYKPILSTAVYSDIFTMMMHLNDSKGEILRTYYVVDTEQIHLPIYALKDIIKDEIQDGFQKGNRLLIIVYSEYDIEHIDVKCSLFFVLQRESEQGAYFEFYNNEKLVDEQE